MNSPEQVLFGAKREIPPEYEEECIYCVGEHTLNRLPREGVENPSLEMFQNHLDAMLCHVLWDDPVGTGRLDQ